MGEPGSFTGAFEVDYAKSARSKCGTCRQGIDKGELRVGAVHVSRHHDGVVPQWHHVGCFKSRWLQKAEQCNLFRACKHIKNINDLKPKDAKMVLDLRGGDDDSDEAGEEEGEDAAAKESSAPKLTAAEKKAKEEAKAVYTEKMKLLEEEGKVLWAVRNKLKGLSTNEMKMLLRANDQPSTGKNYGGETAMLNRIVNGVVFGALPRCKEKGCKSTHTEDLQRTSSTQESDAESESNSDSSSDSDDSSDTSSSSSSSSSSSDDTTSSSDSGLDKKARAKKKAKKAAKKEKKKEKRAKRKAKKAAKKAKKAAKKAKKNKTNTGGAPSGILRVSMSLGKYVCDGSIDTYTKCSFQSEKVKRLDWRVPPGITHSFFKTFKFKKPAQEQLLYDMSYLEVQKSGVKRKRETPHEREPEGDGSAPMEVDKTDAEKEADAADKPPAAKRARKVFTDITVCAAGKLSTTQDAIKEIVEDHGGAFYKGPAVDETADYLITTEKDAKAASNAKIAKALAAERPILVKEGWVKECVDAGAVLAPHELKKTGLGLGNVPEETEEEKRLRIADHIAVARERKKLEGREEEATEEDLKSARRAAELKSGKRVVKKKGGIAVEPDSELDDTHHVYVPKAGTKEIYSVTLNLVDLKKGKNSYYIMQVLEPDNAKKKSWVLFRKWGRIGTAIGGTTSSTFPVVSAATREFAKQFADKTGNTWDAYLSGDFQEKPGYNKVVNVDHSDGAAGDVTDALTAAANLTGYTGDLDEQTRKFIELIFDVKEMEMLLQELEIDTQKMPLGKLARTSLQAGMSVLSEIQKYIEETGGDDAVKDILYPAPNKKFYSKKAQQEEEAERRRITSKLQGMSDRFYTLVPHANIKMEDGALLDSFEKLNKKNDTVQNLMDMEVVTRMLKEDGTSVGLHPIDRHFSSLGCEMVSIGSKDKRFTMINTYLQNTHAPTHNMYRLELGALWEVSRPDEVAKFEKYKTANGLEDTHLLWHGSRLTNWGGILSQGLRIAPPEAPSTGYMFGKGVYFADMSSKSANYCFTTSEKTTGMMVLCEVALGNQLVCHKATYVEKLPKGKHSTFGEGQTRPHKNGHVEHEGMVVPAGKPENVKSVNTSLRYNEFIVYNTEAFKMKYLVQLKFVYNKKCGSFF